MKLSLTLASSVLFGLSELTAGENNSDHLQHAWQRSFLTGEKTQHISRAGLSGDRRLALSQEACERSKMDVEDGTTSCSCEESGDNSTGLTCTNSCQYCDGGQTFCGEQAFSELYDEGGSIIEISESFIYIKGREDIVALEKSGCSYTESGNLTCSTCNVIVNGEECDSCVLNTCASGPAADSQLPAFNCTTIEELAVYDLCDDSLVISSMSVFAFFSTEDDDFEVCNLPADEPTQGPEINGTTVPTMTTTVAPEINGTAAPTMSGEPSSIPSDMPSLVPSGIPSVVPSDQPSLVPTGRPSLNTSAPMATTTDEPTAMTMMTDGPSPTAMEPTEAPAVDPTAAPVGTSTPTFSEASSTRLMLSLGMGGVTLLLLLLLSSL